MNANITLDTIRNRIPALLMIAVIALLPFGRWYELPEFILLVMGMHLMATRWNEIWELTAIRLYVALFLCYWVPTLISTVDAYDPLRSLAKSSAMLRYVPAGIFVVYHLRDIRLHKTLEVAVAAILTFWCVDAIFQFFVGYNLLAMPMSADRLNGIFGETNIKLGQTLSVLSPVLIEYCRRNRTLPVTIAAYLLVLITIILVGTRAAWVSFIVVSFLYIILYARSHPGRWLKSVSVIVLATLLIGFVGYQTSDKFASRVDRTLAAFNGDEQSVDYALANRLPIWKTSVVMAAAHPVNGVGVRSFRYAYLDYAEPGDPWINAEARRGAAHSHQIILEVLTETGIIGLIGLLMALLIVFQCWKQIRSEDRVKPVALLFALAAMTFPINSHLAFYSTYWSLLCWWLVMVYCARIGDCELKNGKIVGIHYHVQQRQNAQGVPGKRQVG